MDKPEKKQPVLAGRQTDGTFARGTSGNPSGRKQGSRHRTTLLVQGLLEGEAETISRKAIELAKAGDMTAIRLVLERILPPRKDAPVRFDLPHVGTVEGVTQAMSMLMQIVGEGELTPSEGQAIAGMLEQQRRCIESTSLEKKLESLETILKTRK